MKSPFRHLVAQALPDAGRVAQMLQTLTARDWLPLAEVFAAALPECDAVLATPGGEILAAQTARIRGLNDLSGQPWEPLGGGGGELVIISAHLQTGDAEAQLVAQAQAAGWRVLRVAAAVERTNQGARQRLSGQGVRVQAALQLADTPAGLIFERRPPERWDIPVLMGAAQGAKGYRA